MDFYELGNLNPSPMLKNLSHEKNKEVSDELGKIVSQVKF